MFKRSICASVMLMLFSVAAHALELTGEDNGRSVTVLLSEPITVTLSGNPTTGYLWEVAELDRELLAMDGEPAFVADSSLTGASGKFTFRFIPKKPGSTVVKLIYHRPWEKDVPPSENFGLTVKVAPAESKTTAIYRSLSGQSMTASFDNELDRVTVTLPGGRTVTLPRALSASGARYSDGTQTFWEHQGGGRFLQGDTVLFEGALQ